MNNAEPVSLSALAKILGRSKSGLHYLERAGHIKRNSLGKFDIAEVQRAIERTVDVAMANRRNPRVGASVRTPSAGRSNGHATNSNTILLDGKRVTIEQAEAERDRCLAALAEIRNGRTPR